MTSDIGLLDELTVEKFAHGEQALATYFATDAAPRREDGGRPAPNDGARFESWGTNDPNRITVDDVLACTLLSIRVARFNGRSESWFTADHVAALRSPTVADRATQLLRALGPDFDLLDMDEAVAVERLAWEPGAPGYDLYRLIRHELGTPDRPGRVAVWKLLARKRPALLAVRDNVVSEKRLNYHGHPWWLPWWRTLKADASLVERLEGLREQLPRQGGLDVPMPSLLRVADIVLWSEPPR